MARRSLLAKTVGAARLEADAFREREDDRGALAQATAVVALAAVSEGVGALDAGVLPAAGAFLATFAGWLLWAALARGLGALLAGGEGAPHGLLAALGFAQAPRLLGFLGYLPVAGWIGSLVIAGWVLVAGLLGARVNSRMGPVRALAVVLPGWTGLVVLRAGFAW